MSEQRDVVVVGGGPAGTAAAILLRQRGLDVLLLDEARFPRDKICGESVSPEAWRLLEAMGAAGAVQALQPRPVRGMALRAPDGTTVRGHSRGHSRCGFAVRRTAFDQALLCTARAAGVEVREAVRAEAPLVADGVVTGVTAANGAGTETLPARLVVAADGRRSVVARRLGLLHEHRRLRKFAVRG